MSMIVGGAAAPESMIRAFDRFDLRVLHAWGMTETTPLGTTSYLKHHLQALSADERYAYRSKQGIAAPFVEVRAMTDTGGGAVGRRDDGRAAGARAMDRRGLLSTRCRSR